MSTRNEDGSPERTTDTTAEPCARCGVRACARLEDGVGEGWFGSTIADASDLYVVVDGTPEGVICDACLSMEMKRKRIVVFSGSNTLEPPLDEDIAVGLFRAGARQAAACLADPVDPGPEPKGLSPRHFQSWNEALRPFARQILNIGGWCGSTGRWFSATDADKPCPREPRFLRLGRLHAIDQALRGLDPLREPALSDRARAAYAYLTELEAVRRDYERWWEEHERGLLGAISELTVDPDASDPS